MTRISRNFKVMFASIFFVSISFACGSIQFGIVTPIPDEKTTIINDAQESKNEEAAAIDEVSQSTEIPAIEPTPTQDFSHLWVEYRDPAYGYGVALPTHWVVNPTPTEGYNGAMTTASYDEAYFLAHSTKGWWTDNIIPEGVIKMDFAGIPDEHPELDLASALQEMYSQSDTTAVLTTEAVVYNGNNVILLTTASPNNLNETYTSVAFRLANDKILLVTAFWGDAFSSPDVQAILNSFAYEGENVILPTIAPNPSLMDATSNEGTSQATAWLGHIYGLPEGGQYDDFILFSPSGAGEFGISGSNPEIESEIRFLRNKKGVDEYAHFWGQFTCGADDYNHCQLLVDKIQRDGYSEENVDGWVGTISAHTFNGGLSHVFQLAGDVPMWYSLHASQDPALQAQIENLRDTGARVKVWGTLMVGVPDVNGLRIEPIRIEVLQSGGKQNPLPGTNLIAGWRLYENQRFGYRVQYPAETEMIVHGPDGGIPTDEIPAGMSVDVYQEQLQQIYPELCVEIRYGQGYVNISAPPNAGARYSPCGRTGVGVAEITPKTAEITLNGQVYTLQGMQIAGADEHSEIFTLNLADGTQINFGGGGRSTTDYEVYLANTKPILLQILASYETVP